MFRVIRILVVTVAAITASVTAIIAEVSSQHWAFQRLAPIAVPDVRAAGRLRTPIDRFVVAKLEAESLSLAPDAARPPFIRRLFLDLSGLPPTREEVDRFQSDPYPDARERLIDRVLASPRFGERWARHWLDVVGYADSVGFDMNPGGIALADGKWRYRDYVIESFNADKPYDLFIRQQLAGDEAVDWREAEKFTPRIVEHLVATGFLRTAQDFSHEPISDIPSNHYAVIHDTLEIVGSSLFAVTLKCARCHDHKYDPIPQADYYSLMACLTPAYNSKNWKAVVPYRPNVADRSLPDASVSEQEEINRHNEPFDREIAVLRERIKAIEQEPTPSGDGQAQGSDIAGIESKIHDLESRRRSWGKIQALWDVGPPPSTYLHIRGNFERLGDEVQPGFLSVLSPGESRQAVDDAVHSPQTSGRRTVLARWVTRRDTPASALLARVMVNRIWMHLFGEGLVPSAGNLGLQSSPPTHPDLLEWLSADFERSGWRIKRLIRQAVASMVYRQSSHRMETEQAAAASLDPENHLLWRMRLRRVDAEVVRDSLLAVGGTLNTTMGGPPIRSITKSDGRVVAEDAGKRRRSIYLMVRRAYNPSLLTVFDQPVIGTSCSRRQPSAVVSQSLTMMNDAFLFEQAEQFAGRIRAEAGLSTDRQVETAFRLGLSRRPNDAERRWCLDHLERQAEIFRGRQSDPEAAALVDLCLTILNTSEFLYTE